MKRVALLMTLLLAVEGRAACKCPASSMSSDLLITTPANGYGGVVACGYEDSRRGQVIRASEFQVFRCDRSKALLSLSATHSAKLQPAGDALRVIEISHWPFGSHWKWVEVPIAEWLLDAHSSTQQVPRPRLSRPRLTKTEVTEFLREYQVWLANPARDHANDEDMVGRLFASMVSGDREAGRLFRSMRSDASLDGAAAEDYATAEYNYRIGRKRLPE